MVKTLIRSLVGFAGLLILAPPQAAAAVLIDSNLNLTIRRTNQNVVLSWFGSNAVPYQLESSSAFAWTNSGSVITGVGGVLFLTNPVYPQSHFFYRVRRVLPPQNISATFNPATGVLTVIGDDTDNIINVSRNPAGALLVNGGAAAITGGIATVANTTRIDIFGRAGSDQLGLDEANGALPRAELFGEAGHDTLTGGPGNDALQGGPGNDTLLGQGGMDTLSGGADNDTLTGGDADDQVFGDAGNDRLIWNPGDDTDLNEGGTETDTVEVNGGNGTEQFTTSANGLRVRFDRVNPAPFALDIGTCENLVLNAGGGDDSFSTAGNLAALIQITVDGGAGNDTLLGSNGIDLLLGGDNNDFIDGQQGNDVAFGGAGDDTFQWDPGDGSDTIEGQSGTDAPVFNTSAASEIVDLSANGARLRLTRNVGNIIMDVDGVERTDCNALGGADIFNLSTLALTVVTQVNLNLAGTLGGSSGDAQVDLINLNGQAGIDTFNLAANAGAVEASGLGALVRVLNAELTNDSINIVGVGNDIANINGSAGPDTMAVAANGTNAQVTATGFTCPINVRGSLTLVVNGFGGFDNISCTGNLAALVPLILDGGNDNDTILGSNGPDLLLGGAGNDFIDGQQGNDIAFGGGDNDTFQWDPGDGSDTIEGQGGSDALVFNGSAGSEIFSLAANGSRFRLTRNVGNIIMDVDGIERLDCNALSGADIFNVATLALTVVTQVNLNLAGTLGGSSGDAQIDLINLNGQAGADTFNLAANAGAVEASGLGALVRVLNSEPANDSINIVGVGNDIANINGSAGPDTMTVAANGTNAQVTATGFTCPVNVSGALTLAVNGLGGIDNISCTGNLAGLFPLILDGGNDNDTILGSNGPDLLLGGAGNDFIDGQQGNDTAFGGGDNDTFQWDPGDGSDTIEGQGGSDALVFNGSAGSEIFFLAANGPRLRMTRNVGNIIMDVDGVERVDCNALGGADGITVDSLVGTAVTLVNLDLTGTLGGAAGDAQIDGISINGTAAADTINTTASSGVVNVSGLSASVRILHAEASNDTLTINGLGGIDSFTIGAGVSSLIQVTTNQN